MSWTVTIGGTAFPINVLSQERTLEPQIHIQNPVASANLTSNVSMNWTATPSQRITLRGRLLVSGVGTVVSAYGPNSPGTASSAQYNPSGGSSGLWNNPNNIKVADGSVANSQGPGGSATYLSQQLFATNFGFAVPSTSSVVGVLVEIKERETQNTGHDEDLSLYLNGSIISESKAETTTGTSTTLTYPSWPLTLTYRGYGGSTDTWNASFLPATVNNAAFGTGLIAYTSNANGNLEVDHVRMTVYAISNNISTTATLDVFETAVRDGNAVTLTDDEGTATSCYIIKFQADRIQTVGANKYSMVTLSLVKNG